MVEVVCLGLLKAYGDFLILYISKSLIVFLSLTQMILVGMSLTLLVELRSCVVKYNGVIYVLSCSDEQYSPTENQVVGYRKLKLTGEWDYKLVHLS